MAAAAVTPLGAAVRGLVAGAAGTAVMTAYQKAVSRARSSGGDGSDSRPSSWEEAPPPARVARRFYGAVLGRELDVRHAPLLANLVHWAYGTAQGAVYGLVQSSLRPRPAVHGAAFGAGVWAFSYANLVPMGLYEAPWRYAPKTLAVDLSYHLVYGLGVAAAYEASEDL